MPPLTDQRLALHLKPAAVRAVRQGHPWVFADSIRKQSGDGPAGALGVLFDPNRQFVGIGLYDPESPIRVRVLHAGKPLTIDAEWLRGQLEQAFARRAPLMEDPGTDGYRLLHGENDGLPGCVVDRYAETLVVKLDTGAWCPYLPLLQDLLLSLTGAERLILRLSRSVRTEYEDGQILAGSALTRPVLFRENGLVFEAEPIDGQKTGFFLDQRDNRAKVETLAAGRRVLNVFAYTGGFSLYALRGGARSVTSLDISQPALEAARRNLGHNPELDASAHECLAADSFAALGDLAAAGERYDLVILDPPSFARKQRDIPQALAAYERLTRLGLQVLAPQGVLVTASCSARVPADDFFATVAAQIQATPHSFQEIARTGHALDHPIGFAEGAYLKCLFSRASG